MNRRDVAGRVRGRRRAALVGQRRRHRQHESRRRLFAAGQHHARDRAVAARVGDGPAISSRLMRRSRSPTTRSAMSRTRRPTIAAQPSSIRDNGAAANSYAVFLCNRQNRWADAEPFFRLAADDASYPTPEVALTNAGVCARDGRRDRSGGREFSCGARAQCELPRRVAQHDGAVAPAAAIRCKRARSCSVISLPTSRRRPCSGLCVNVERELDDAAAADRCASQLRSGFRGSAEVAQLEELTEAQWPIATTPPSAPAAAAAARKPRGRCCALPGSLRISRSSSFDGAAHRSEAVAARSKRIASSKSACPCSSRAI